MTCRTQTGRHRGHIQAVRTTRSPYAVHAHDRPLASLHATDNTIYIPTGHDRVRWRPSEAEGGHASRAAPAIRLESRLRAEAHRARFTGKAGQSSKKAHMQRKKRRHAAHRERGSCRGHWHSSRCRTRRRARPVCCSRACRRRVPAQKVSCGRQTRRNVSRFKALESMVGMFSVTSEAPGGIAS